MMSIKRKLEKVHSPESQPGFLGPGHTARPVLSGTYQDTDPFIILMDDVLDKKDNEPVGGPHPHAGFETVTLLLEGEIGDEKHTMEAGDFQMMTAGSGIVHTETIDKKARMRLLQLWINLPKEKRWTEPRVQDIPLEHVPAMSQDGVNIKLYSGSLAGLKSPIKNYVPLIVADIAVDPSVITIQQIPANYNTFLYVISGSVKVGEDETLLKQNQVGWLNLFGVEADSELKLVAGQEGVRFVLYAGKPLGETIVSYGPFIADNTEDIKRLYQDYRQGRMKHIASVPESQRIMV